MQVVNLRGLLLPKLLIRTYRVTVLEVSSDFGDLSFKSSAGKWFLIWIFNAIVWSLKHYSSPTPAPPTWIIVKQIIMIPFGNLR